MNMKRICCIISLFVLCLTFNQAHAQRCLPGMKGLQVTGGMADGVHWNSKSDFAYYFGAAMSTYTKNGNRWVVGGEYLEKHYPYKDLQIPVSQFTGEGGYYLNFLSDRKKTFFLSLGLSALAGYETSNWGDTLTPKGSSITEGKTKPKPLHTEATLLSAMETVGKEIEDDALRQAMKDCGIGTPATHAPPSSKRFSSAVTWNAARSRLFPPKKDLPSIPSSRRCASPMLP